MEDVLNTQQQKIFLTSNIFFIDFATPNQMLKVNIKLPLVSLTDL